MSSNQGFVWVDEGRHTHAPKLGFTALAVGSSITFKLNTQQAQQPQPQGGVASSSGSVLPELVSVQIGHLKSYEKHGVASVSCVSGCRCNTTRMDGHHEIRHSQTFLHPMLVTQSPACLMRLEVLGETRSGLHKVRVRDERDKRAGPAPSLCCVPDLSPEPCTLPVLCA